MSNIEQLRKWCNGTWLACAQPDAVITVLATDSRHIVQPEAAVFIALKTPLRDAHAFLGAAWAQGVRSFIVADDATVDLPHGGNIIKVKNTLEALQHIAAAHRRLYTMPVIGITGSNGKTIVKEWLYQLLSGTYNIVRSPKSYNSQVGVPLSVWLMGEQYNMALLEAGISQPGEMERLEPMIRPDIGIFTNIGEAHNEGFENIQQKIDEKLKLFRHARHLIYCRDHAQLHAAVTQYAAGLHNIDGLAAGGFHLFSWSATGDADLQIMAVERTGNKTFIQGVHKGVDSTITIPFTDGASVENVIHCWCVLLLLGIPSERIQEHMALLQRVSMRLELRHGINDCTLINDAYNSDLTSLQLALNYLDQQQQHHHHTVILSDILQPGRADADLYTEIAALISRRHIQRFIGIGPALYKNKAAFRRYKKLRSIFFKNTDEFLAQFHLLSFAREAILLKGARVFAFEKIALVLEQQVHQTSLSIDLSAMRQNFNVFRGMLNEGVKTMAMVKAFAYGSGSYEIASLLQHAGADYLTVAYTDEGIDLRRAGIKMPIMVMSPDLGSFDRMIAWQLEPELYSFRSLAAFSTMAATLKVKDYPVHIKLDTGMHRLGLGPQDIDALAALLAGDPLLRTASIFSHLAAADSAEQDDFTAQQAALFAEMSGRLAQALGYTPLLHLCNSAGIVRHRALQHSMVRLGIGLYGIDSSSDLNNKLQQISTLKTTIAQIHDVPAGDSVGYGHKTVLATPTRIATISIGYADGYPRSLGHGSAYVLVHGWQAPTVGAVCMDMCMVDITNIPDAREGDEAIVFGPALPVAQLAAWAGTISYEILTGISQRVRRVYINEE